MIRAPSILAVSIAALLFLSAAGPGVAQKKETTVAPEIKGEVTKVDLKKREFAVATKAKDSPINFQLGEDASTYLNGAKSSFEEMKAGDKVNVEHYRQEGDNWYAIIIRLDRKIEAKEVTVAGEIRGEVTNVEPEKLEFTAATDVKKAPINFQLGEDASIYINGAEATINEMKAGDRVNVEHYHQEGQNWYAVIIRIDRK